MIADLKPYAEYKESGLPWLGQVPASWRLRRAKFLFREIDERSTTGKEELLSVSHKTGVTPRSQKTITMFLAKSNVGHKICRPQDLVINTLWAWMAALGVSRHTGIVSPAYGIYRPIATDQLLPGFADSLFRTPTYAGEYQRRSTGVNSSRLRLYPEDFLRIHVLLPGPDEQAAIVRFLDWANGRLERAIRAKRKVIALLNEQKQAIIHRAVTRGLDPSVPLKPSGIPWLGDIPQHWEVRRLRTISPRIGVGLVINPSSYFVDEGHPGSVPMLLGNNIMPNGFRLSKVRWIGADDNRRLGASRLTAGDVVVVRVGAPGVAAVVPASLDGCNCASVMIVRKHHSFLPQWLAHNFNSPVVASQIDVVKYGAAQKQFNIGHAVDFLFPVPPMEEQRAIVESISAECAPVDTAISRLEREIELLREYRTRLVADVVTGKLDVREAAARLPDESPLDSIKDEADLTDESEAADEEAIVE